MMDPEDYKGGVEEMINDTSGDPYDGLIPLGQRKTTEIKVKAGDSATEADLALKFGYSQPIALLFKMTQKMYGYMRDANITDPLEHHRPPRTGSVQGRQCPERHHLRRRLPQPAGAVRR